ncbi:MAG: hypothetical protein AB9891_09475 [Anaerolineaceae bacterium]
MVTGLRQKIKVKIHPSTMLTWSRVIETFESLPGIYQSFFRQLQGETDGELPYIVLTPAVEWGFRKTPELLICSAQDILYVLENLEKNLTITTFPTNLILDIEVGAILLFSWLTIRGVTSDGLFSSKTIEFNSVSYPHFIPCINLARNAPAAPNAPALEHEKQKFEFLTPYTYKFTNYGRKSLMGDEKVLQIIWQPEIREPMFSRLGMVFHRTVSYAHLSILTDEELILIREDDLTHITKGNRYGGIWRYIPHRSLRSVRLIESDHGKLILTIGLAGKTEIQVMFRIENRPQLDEFVRMVEGILEREASPAV